MSKLYLRSIHTRLIWESHFDGRQLIKQCKTINYLLVLIVSPPWSLTHSLLLIKKLQLCLLFTYTCLLSWLNVIVSCSCVCMGDPSLPFYCTHNPCLRECQLVFVMYLYKLCRPTIYLPMIHCLLLLSIFFKCSLISTNLCICSEVVSIVSPVVVLRPSISSTRLSRYRW
jgi:hypothetical protein